ncbi:MAG TPA: FmdB family zinc ribbon protein [Roseateles sp.]
MPIYAYRCSACGHAKDVLQKLSDAPLTTCPSCNAEAFGKQVTAAGFQLKGSGWYVTDFRGGSGGGSAASTPAPAAEPAKTESGGSSGETSSASSSSTPCGGSCACH